MSISEEVSAIGQTFVDSLKRILGEKLYGAYIYGAAAFPETIVTGDIDYHVILRSVLTDAEQLELEKLHQSPPPGKEMDGSTSTANGIRTRLSMPSRSAIGSCPRLLRFSLRVQLGISAATVACLLCLEELRCSVRG